MKAKNWLITSAVTLSSMFCMLKSSEVKAAPVTLDPEARLKISNELSYMALEHSQLSFSELTYPPDQHPLFMPMPPRYLFAEDANIKISDMNEEEMEPLHVGTAKLTNHTNADQDMRTQEYSQTYTDSVTNTATHTFKIGLDSKGSIEIPLAKFESTLKIEYDFSTTNSKTRTESKIYKINSQVVKVPAGKTYLVKAKLVKGKATAKLALSTALNTQIPYGYDKDGLLYHDGGLWAVLYQWDYRMDKLPKHEYSTQYDSRRKDGKSQMTYDGGYSKVLSEFGSHLTLDFYDITNGEQNAKLVETRIGAPGVFVNK